MIEQKDTPMIFINHYIEAILEHVEVRVQMDRLVATAAGRGRADQLSDPQELHGPLFPLVSVPFARHWAEG